MPDDPLLATYLDRLGDALPLPEAERRATVEEIASHVSMTADALEEGGLPRDVAERRALERLGAPERLAADIADSHRAPGHLLAAAGAALRISVVAGTRAFILAWTGAFLMALVLGLVVAGIRRLLGPGFLQVDWSPVLDGALPAIVASIAAFAVGRALVGPVAIAARRSQRDVRLPLLVVGVAVTGLIGLTAVEARWTLGTAALMATMPAWFALGVIRPNLVPSRHVSGNAMIWILVLVLAGSAALAFVAGGASQALSSREAATMDPNVEYAAIGPFVSIEHPPVAIDLDGASAGPWQGVGPVHVRRTGTVADAFAFPWTGLRLEVWPGPIGELDGSALDPTATEPLAMAPMAVDGRMVSGEVDFSPLTDRHFYYVAVTGVDADGRRWQLAWPGVESWDWRGTPLELFLTTWR